MHAYKKAARRGIRDRLHVDTEEENEPEGISEQENDSVHQSDEVISVCWPDRAFGAGVKTGRERQTDIKQHRGRSRRTYM